jgi:hypothetical protein
MVWLWLTVTVLVPACAITASSVLVGTVPRSQLDATFQVPLLPIQVNVAIGVLARVALA